MKELDFLKIINETLSKNSHIGDDCAYLKDLGIVITQDSMVEDIHFSRNFASPYQLGYRAIIVNLSDIFASGALPKYITVSLSLPKNIDNSFVKEFYGAIEKLAQEYDFEVVGGDITGGDKVFISVCAIGLTKDRNISSRSYAKDGDYVITTGSYGSSVAGLWLLQNKTDLDFPSIIDAHLLPTVQSDFSKQLATKLVGTYAMMDTSDGLADALFKIAQASNVLISVDFNKIPYDKNIEEVSQMANVDLRGWVLYGGEDYQMVACVDAESLKMLTDYTIIGRVKEKSENHYVQVIFDDKIEKISDLEKTFDHFRRSNEI